MYIYMHDTREQSTQLYKFNSNKSNHALLPNVETNLSDLPRQSSFYFKENMFLCYQSVFSIFSCSSFYKTSWKSHTVRYYYK